MMQLAQQGLSCGINPFKQNFMKTYLQKHHLIALFMLLSCNNEASKTTTLNHSEAISVNTNLFECEDFTHKTWYEIGTWIVDRHNDTLAISDLWAENNLADRMKVISEEGARIEMKSGRSYEGQLDDGMGLYPIHGTFLQKSDTLFIEYKDDDGEMISHKCLTFCQDDFFMTIGDDWGIVKLYSEKQNIQKCMALIEKDKELIAHFYQQGIESKGFKHFIYARKIYKREGIYLQKITQ